jgi:uncharacterized protein YndB with AHSA1/START domain
MSDPKPATKSVIVERDLAHAPEKIWRALTQPHLIAEWLMKSDFQPVVGHKFDFTADWGSVGCQVTEVEPNRSLAYTWGAMGVETVVTWTLTPQGAGTHLRMEQSGFSAAPEAARYYGGAMYGWQNFFANLEKTLEGLA